MKKLPKNELIKRIVVSAVCLALTIVLPLAFHAIPNSAVIFSPIHIPVLICGLVCGYQFGLIVGLFGPILCLLITGMPTLINLPGMIVECMIYGCLPYLFLMLVKFKKLYLSIYIGLIISILIGRCFGGLISALVYLGTGEGYSISIWATSYFVKGWPGIIIQIILVPNLVFLLMKAKLVTIGYKKQINVKKKEYEE